MSFLLGMNCQKYCLPRPKLVHVGDIVFKDRDREEAVKITCFPDTGTLFMNGRFGPTDLTIGGTLGWYMNEPIYEIDIEELYFMNGSSLERGARMWERNAFLVGHWKQYAKTGIYVRAIIRLSDPNENESVYLTIAGQ
jgi:hypothetical protein